MGKVKYYAVRKGRSTGIYNSWSECSDNVTKYSGAEFKSFNTHAEALAYANGSSRPSASSYSSENYTPYSRNPSKTTRQKPARTHVSPSAYVVPSHQPAAGSLSRNSNYYQETSLPSESSHSSFSSLAPSANRRTGTTGNSATPQKTVQEIYTDGSCLGNGKKVAHAGWGMYWGDSRDSYGSIDKSTNNAGELTAIKMALGEIVERGSQDTDYTIYSDSEYSINGLTKWTPGWESRNWKTSSGGDVQNADLFRENLSLLKKANEKGYNVKLEKIKAHSNHYGNEMADKLAKKGAEKGRGY